MKLRTFLPVVIAAMVLGVGGFVLAGDAFAGCISGAWGEPCLEDSPSPFPRGPRDEPEPEPEPDPATEAFRTGYRLSNQERYSEAEAYYRQAIALNPRYASAHWNLARVLERQGRYDESVAEMREALRLDPRNKKYKQELAPWEEYLQKKQEQAEHNTRIDAYNAARNRGIDLYEKNDYRGAEAAFREAIRIFPDDDAQHYNLGLALKLQKRFDEAEAAYSEAVRLRPGSSKAREELAWLRRERDTTAKVRRMLDDMQAETRPSSVSSGSLEFIGPSEPLLAKGAKASSSEGLQFMDPRQEEQTQAVQEGRVVLTLPNKPTYQEGRMMTDPGAQLKSAEKTGKWAQEAAARPLDPHALERASGRAGIGFDTPGFKEGRLNIDDSAPPVKGAPVKGQAVLRIPKGFEDRKEAKLFKRDWERLNQQIRESEKKLAAVREQISQTKDKDKVPKLRLEESNLKAQVFEDEYNQKVLQRQVNTWAINLGGDASPAEPASSPAGDGTPQPVSGTGN